jgi:hypothetical protein
MITNSYKVITNASTGTLVIPITPERRAGFETVEIEIAPGVQVDLSTKLARSITERSAELLRAFTAGLITVQEYYPPSAVAVSGAYAVANGTPDLTVGVSQGFGYAISTGLGFFIAAVAAGGSLAVTAATATKKKLAIVQVSGAGVVSVKQGAEVLEADVAVYPTPDTNNRLLAYLFTNAAPILSSTTTVLNSDINNVVSGR